MPLSHDQRESALTRALGVAAGETVRIELPDSSSWPDEPELSQCLECGHLHYNAVTGEYADCPICSCEGQA